MRAALIHQYTRTERDRGIAQEMAALVEHERRLGGDDPDGSEGLPRSADRTTRVGVHFHDQVGTVGAGKSVGAGDGNRTRVASLEDWGSTIELRPHAPEAT
jgi:hypothetical protein